MLIFQINYGICGQNLSAAGSFIKKNTHIHINACLYYNVYFLFFHLYIYNKCSVLGPSTQAPGYPILYMHITRLRPPIEI